MADQFTSETGNTDGLYIIEGRGGTIFVEAPSARNAAGKAPGIAAAEGVELGGSFSSRPATPEERKTYLKAK